MAAYTRDEALAFIEAMRLTLEGKVGFKWLLEKLSDLQAYVEDLATENEQLNSYIDSSDQRELLEQFRADSRPSH